MRWMPSPQSPGISPCARHWGYGDVTDGGIPPVSLVTTLFPWMVTSQMDPYLREPVARIPSPIAPVTVKPVTVTWECLMVTAARQGAEPGPVGPSWSHIPLAVADPLIVASRPRRVNALATMTSSVYV